MEVRYGPYIWYFIWSLADGVLLAFVYDVLRFSRRVVKTNDTLINIEDILFFVLSAILVFATAYTVNNGMIRSYGLIGCAIGFFLYRIAVGNRIVELLSVVYKGICKGVEFILKILLMPLRFFIRVAGRPVFITVSRVARKTKGKIGIKKSKKNGQKVG